MPDQEKKPTPTPVTPLAEMAYYLLPLLLLVFFFSFLSANIDIWRLESFFYSFLENLVYPVSILMFMLVVSIFFYSYYSYKINILLQREQENSAQRQISFTEPQKNERWNRILDHIRSEHPNDWRIAILEADTILDELLDKMGYTAETVAGKLKQVEKSDFSTLENAWKAHKLRNRIAHDSDFVLSKREAERVVDLYRSVFEEFKFI
ncbi:MAG: hypothetical protein ACLFNN_03065 [Candidatus Paceibacterota bacterium]